MSPEEAYELLESIAIISGTQAKLSKLKESGISSNKQKIRKPSINFDKCGIPIGAELVYIEDNSVRVIVHDDRKVLYNNEITSLSSIVGRMKNVKAVAGPSYFTYNGRNIVDIANETQWKE